MPARSPPAQARHARDGLRAPQPRLPGSEGAKNRPRHASRSPRTHRAGPARAGRRPRHVAAHRRHICERGPRFAIITAYNARNAPPPRLRNDGASSRPFEGQKAGARRAGRTGRPRAERLAKNLKIDIPSHNPAGRRTRPSLRPAKFNRRRLTADPRPTFAFCDVSSVI
ncbi:hypothetical protein EVAR_66251_1 [Eumeta japonica]|uniref:Uncharacterized protein n=1 Tax=Eumeta variegata TaxID=151549 RepID=A0A4C1ZYL8_EUMVA|nr:hypothetical protein EVAR_66251_1 [Eumeta japonica]